MTQLFHQIVPRLTRTLRRGDAAPATPGTAGESTYTLKPAYTITETDTAWAVTVQLPGVAKDGLELTAEENRLALRGRRTWTPPAGWTQLQRESDDAPFLLTLEHDNTVNVDAIRAELQDGILRLTLPKVEALKPRKIAIA